MSAEPENQVLRDSSLQSDWIIKEISTNVTVQKMYPQFYKSKMILEQFYVCMFITGLFLVFLLSFPSLFPIFIIMKCSRLW